MAANLGESALANVHQEGLNELLSELASCYPGHEDNAQSFGVPELDALLEIFAPKASQYQDRRASDQDQLRDYQAAAYEEMLMEGSPHPEDAHGPNIMDAAEDLDPANTLFSDPEGTQNRPPPILEISSSLSSSGKSQMLYYLTAHAILPREYGTIAIGGREAAVIFIDTDDRFDAERLRVVARGIIQQSLSNLPSNFGEQSAGCPTDHDIEALLVSSLQHVHVFCPQSSSALLATLHSLDSYLFDLSRHRSASRPLQMIAIDSTTAFIWQDRLRDEVARTEEIGRSREEIDSEREQKRRFSLPVLYDELATQLKRLQSRFHCSIVYTSVVSGGRPAADLYESESRFSTLKPALPAPWGTLPTLRLIFHRPTVRPFPPSMAPQAAVKEAPSRQDAVQQGKISGWVNEWGRDGWPRRIMEAIEASNGGGFSFLVRESGVEFNSPTD
ncbi:hypothetical protein N7541_001684 [Penicillium brevicompactum]|uniref:DNA recombination and repair protein Rad51-like C-terminal domain-containing protein n=1 Tax=Penicillium brevicompactum TaxID=5074 RepID=A0A9W9RWM2_PENBR|nr:hypothetical protein N7541_001684 [Penicillium brevicompactum]